MASFVPLPVDELAWFSGAGEHSYARLRLPRARQRALWWRATRCSWCAYHGAGACHRSV